VLNNTRQYLSWNRGHAPPPRRDPKKSDGLIELPTRTATHYIAGGQEKAVMQGSRRAVFLLSSWLNA
jgi:hypothetical protein